jgi:hypothetical protein
MTKLYKKIKSYNNLAIYEPFGDNRKKPKAKSKKSSTSHPVLQKVESNDGSTIIQDDPDIITCEEASVKFNCGDELYPRWGGYSSTLTKFKDYNGDTDLICDRVGGPGHTEGAIPICTQDKFNQECCGPSCLTKKKELIGNTGNECGTSKKKIMADRGLPNKNDYELNTYALSCCGEFETCNDIKKKEECLKGTKYNTELDKPQYLKGGIKRSDRYSYGSSAGNFTTDDFNKKCCIPQTCTSPSDTTGYNVNETNKTINGFDVTASCADNYEGTAVVTKCGRDGEPYTLSNCTPKACTTPSDTTGYKDITETTKNFNGFEVTASCADNYEGTAGVTKCSNDDEPYTLSGCTLKTCTTPSDTTGYNVTETSKNFNGFDVTASCADNYSGTAKVTKCSSDGQPYILSGCTPKTCPLIKDKDNCKASTLVCKWFERSNSEHVTKSAAKDYCYKDYGVLTSKTKELCFQRNGYWCDSTVLDVKVCMNSNTEDDTKNCINKQDEEKAKTTEEKAKTKEGKSKATEEKSKATEEKAKTTEEKAKTTEEKAKTTEEKAKTTEEKAKTTEKAKATKEATKQITVASTEGLFSMANLPYWITIGVLFILFIIALIM